MANKLTNTFQWVEKIVRLTDLVPYERNPRNISESQYDKLKSSIKEDGYHSRIKATHDLQVIGGHQRLRVLAELGYKEVPVLIPSQPVDFETFRRIVVRDNVTNGVFDIDVLACDYDLDELKLWGVDEALCLPPVEDEPEVAEDTRSGNWYKCPKCEHEFSGKGNKV